MTTPFGLLIDDQLQPPLAPQQTPATPPMRVPMAPNARTLRVGDPRLSFWQTLRWKYPMNARLAFERALSLPEGMQGLLSDADVGNARSRGLMDFGLAMLENSRGAPGQNAPSFGQALARGVQAGRQGFEGGVSSALQAAQYGQQMKQQQKIASARERIAQMYPPTPGETPDQTVQRFKKMFASFAQVGDTEMVGKLAEAVKAMTSGEQAIHYQDLGDRTAVLDPRGNVIRYEKNGPKPKTPEEVGAADRFTATERNRILDDYRADTRMFHQALEGYKVLQGAIKHPGIATPFAVLDAYARVVNPGAVVRQGTMQVLQEMGAYDDKVRRWLEQARSGSWPTDMIENIKNTLDAIMAEHQTQYQDARRRAMERAKISKVGDITNLLDRDQYQFGSEGGGKSEGGDQRWKQYDRY